MGNKKPTAPFGAAGVYGWSVRVLARGWCQGGYGDGYRKWLSG